MLLLRSNKRTKWINVLIQVSGVIQLRRDINFADSCWTWYIICSMLIWSQQLGRCSQTTKSTVSISHVALCCRRLSASAQNRNMATNSIPKLPLPFGRNQLSLTFPFGLHCVPIGGHKNVRIGQLWLLFIHLATRRRAALDLTGERSMFLPCLASIRFAFCLEVSHPDRMPLFDYRRHFNPNKLQRNDIIW